MTDSLKGFNHEPSMCSGWDTENLNMPAPDGKRNPDCYSQDCPQGQGLMSQASSTSVRMGQVWARAGGDTMRTITSRSHRCSHGATVEQTPGPSARGSRHCARVCAWDWGPPELGEAVLSCVACMGHLRQLTQVTQSAYSIASGPLGRGNGYNFIWGILVVRHEHWATSPGLYYVLFWDRVLLNHWVIQETWICHSPVSASQWITGMCHHADMLQSSFRNYVISLLQCSFGKTSGRADQT